MYDSTLTAVCLEVSPVGGSSGRHSAAYQSHEEEWCEQGSQYITGSERKLPFVLFCLCFSVPN